MEDTVTNPHSNQYKITAITSDIASHRPFKLDCIGKNKKEKISFLNISLANKSLDGVNLGNILHHKLVQWNIPPYFKDKSLIPIPNILQLQTRFAGS